MERGFTFEDVVADRGAIRALDGFTAKVPGSGVAALLRLCNRLEMPTSGRVLFGGRDVTGLDP